MATKNFNFNPQYYDLQTDREKRMEKERGFFENIFKRRKISRVLDIGCGTGHHAELFAEYVREVVAIDPDPDMIDHMKNNVIMPQNITLYRAGFEELDRIPDGKFDMITSLENTLPILGNPKKIKRALKRIKGRLSENGIAVFQFLNFSSRIIDENNYYPPEVFEKDGFSYIYIKHFQYGKKKTRMDHIITKLDDGKVDDFFINSTYLATLKANMFKSMAINSGFKKIELVGTEGIDRFDPKKHISLYALLTRKEN